MIRVNTPVSIKRQTRCCHCRGRIFQFQITCCAQPPVITPQFALIMLVRLWDTQRRHLARTLYHQMFKCKIVRREGFLYIGESFGILHQKYDKQSKYATLTGLSLISALMRLRMTAGGTDKLSTRWVEKVSLSRRRLCRRTGWPERIHQDLFYLFNGGHSETTLQWLLIVCPIHINPKAFWVLPHIWIFLHLYSPMTCKKRSQLYVFLIVSASLAFLQFQVFKFEGQIQTCRRALTGQKYFNRDGG